MSRTFIGIGRKWFDRNRAEQFLGDGYQPAYAAQALYLTRLGNYVLEDVDEGHWEQLEPERAYDWLVANGAGDAVPEAALAEHEV